MKFNNPTKFFQEIGNSESDDLNVNNLKAKQRATIVTRGDFIKLYSETDSNDPSAWHVEATPNDTWWQMSFDGRSHLST